MKNTKFRGAALVASALVLGAWGVLWAQKTDAADCQDHPLFPRMEGFTIFECKSDVESVDFYVSTSGETQTVEGRMTKFTYVLQAGASQPTPLQIRSYYGAAVKSLGGAVLLDVETHQTSKVIKNGKEIWVDIEVGSGGRDYILIVMEKGGQS
jgi:hypothetical protein